MIASLLVVVGQVVTLFLMMSVGFTLSKLGKLSRDTVSQLSYLLLYIVAPCVIIQSFETENTPELLKNILIFGSIFAVTYVIYIGVSQLCFSRETETRRSPLRFGLVYGNNGFMGLPLLLSVLGREAVIFGVISVVIFNLFQWTHGVSVMGGKVTLRQALINPGTIGLAAGLVLFLTGWRLPGMIDGAVGNIAALNTPLAMVVVGAQMAGADLRVCFTSSKLYGAALFKLVLAPLLPLLLLLPLLTLGLDPMVYCACVVMCAVPTAGATSMLAQRFERDTALAAQMVTLSTILSVATLPLASVAAQTLSGLSTF